MMNILVLEDEKTWPEDAVFFLESNIDLFHRWYKEPAHAKNYDDAVIQFRNIIRTDYVLRGYHCTRLTDDEVEIIINNGMALPDIDMLHVRITAIEQKRLIDANLANYLRDKNQGNDENRKGRIWFCFFKPYLAGQLGIGRFFQSWGGEALYNSHEDDPLSGEILTKIGTPCIIEAFVPIGSLSYHGGLDFKLIDFFLFNRGLKKTYDLNHEDRSLIPIPANNISRIIKYPQEDFINLTKCNKWSRFRL